MQPLMGDAPLLEQYLVEIGRVVIRQEATEPVDDPRLEKDRRPSAFICSTYRWAQCSKIVLGLSMRMTFSR